MNYIVIYFFSCFLLFIYRFVHYHIDALIMNIMLHDA